MEDQIKKSWGGKRRIIGIVFMLAVLGGAAYYACSWNYFYHNAPERVGKDMTYIWQWKMYAGGMKSAYAKDTYGGATPEETLELFVSALRAGDTTLAAKYYVSEKQDKVFSDLEKGISSENFNKYVTFVEGFLSNTNKSTSTSAELYLISYPYGADGFSTTMQFSENKLTQKWKISAP